MPLLWVDIIVDLLHGCMDGMHGSARARAFSSSFPHSSLHILAKLDLLVVSLLTAGLVYTVSEAFALCVRFQELPRRNAA